MLLAAQEELHVPESTVTVNELPYAGSAGRERRWRVFKRSLPRVPASSWSTRRPRGTSFQDLTPEGAEGLAALINERAKGEASGAGS